MREMFLPGCVVLGGIDAIVPIFFHKNGPQQCDKSGTL
jgi:hypothetical protein